jgi:Mg-chelatase subunit ChlD
MNIDTLLTRPSVRGFEFRLGLEAYAHKVAKSLGLGGVNVHWYSGIQTAGINTYGDLCLSNVTDEAIVSRALVVKYAGFVVHELLHRKYTDFNVQSHIDYIRTLHNAVEDGWIENTAIRSGLLGNIAPLLGELIDTMSRQALAEVSDWNNPAQYPYLLAVHCRKHTTVKLPVNPRLLPIFDEAARRCAIANSSADTLLIAEWVYDQIKQESEKPNDQPKDKPKKGKGKADKNTPSEPQDGPTSPSNEQGEGEGEGEGKKPSDAPVQSPEGVDAKEVEPQLEDGGGYGSYSSDSDVQPSSHCTRGKLNLPDLAIPAKLRYEVKRLFDNTGVSEFSRNRKFGSVNVHALPTVATGNDRVFKRRLDVEGIDSAVVIVLDISGSMFNSNDPADQKIVPAAQACRALVDTLESAGVRVAVVAFGSSVFEVKPFDMNRRKANVLLGQMAPAGGTNDYSALRYAHQLLARRTENRKLSFVITDGRGDPPAVRQQVKSGIAFGITTIGVGIRADVSDIYANAVTIHNAKEIGDVSFKQIKLAA